MTSPSGSERTYTIWYKAIGDFSDLVRKTREARAARRAMHDEEVKGSRDSAQANKSAEDVEKLRIKTTQNLGQESKKSSNIIKDAYNIIRKSSEDASKSIKN